MKTFKAFGLASKHYMSARAAADDTYTTKDGELKSTPLIFDDNPFNEDVKNAKVIFEIGCGVGRNVKWIMENTHANYYSVEPNPTMYKYFWEFNDDKHKDRIYVSQDFDDTIYNISIDIVVSTFVFQHIGYMPGNDTKNVSDITDDIRKITKNGTVWILFEHDSEDRWIDRWFFDQRILPNIYIRGYKKIEYLTHRDHYTKDGHHLIIWKQ